jgi:hypothetical protein
VVLNKKIDDLTNELKSQTSKDHENMIQIQMAMQMHEVEQRMRERQMLVMMMSNTYN